MKKIIALTLSLLLLLTLAACGEKAPEEPAITRATEAAPTTEATQATEAPTETEKAAAAVPATFVLEGVEIIPGTVFDPAAVPEADSVYSAPSCAIDGSDNTYSYQGFEIVTMDDGKTETVCSIFLLDPSAATAEGLKVGDKLTRAEELYGTDYTEEGSARIYTYDNGVVLSLITQGDAIQNIELRTK